jgi:hypothetical protein
MYLHFYEDFEWFLWFVVVLVLAAVGYRTFVILKSLCEFIKQMARYAGLIGGNGDGVACLAEGCNGINAARDRYPLVRRLDVVVGVFVDDTIPIQNDQLHVTLNWFADRRYQRLRGTDS